MFKLNPPGAKIKKQWEKWEECDALTQASMIAYYQTHEYENYEKAKLGLMARA